MPSLKCLRGDTIVEVTIAITIFAAVATITINTMNAGIATAQATLEAGMARNEIDAQAEALRFIHDSYAAERSLLAKDQKYQGLWRRLVSKAVNATDLADLQASSCDARYDTSTPRNLRANHAFIVNTRQILPVSPGSLAGGVKPQDATQSKQTILFSDDSSTSAAFQPSPLYPRLIFKTATGSATTDNLALDEGGHNSESTQNTNYYRYVARAEGIWIIAVRDSTDNSSSSSSGIGSVPKFYDFHIYTCWVSPNQYSPTAIGTIVRLYNPEILKND